MTNCRLRCQCEYFFARQYIPVKHLLLLCYKVYTPELIDPAEEIAGWYVDGMSLCQLEFSRQAERLQAYLDGLRACLRSIVLLWRGYPQSHMRPHFRCGNRGGWSQESRIQAM